MKAALVLVLMVSAISASAHGKRERDSRDCIRENWSLVKREVTSGKTCEKDLDLNLTEALFVYPFINVGPINVRYWEGSFVKTQIVKDTYNHEFANICTGKVTYSSKQVTEYAQNKIFTVKNPNLDRSILESYRLTPMTDAEAMTAYEYVKGECEADLAL